jgi:hypothetical protein
MLPLATNTGKQKTTVRKKLLLTDFLFICFGCRKQPAYYLLRIAFLKNTFSVQTIYMKRLLALPLTGSVLLAILLQSCKHDSDSGASTLRKWSDVELKAVYEVPAPAGRNEEGEATIELLNDNSLKYTFHIHNLSPSDALTNAHIHAGDAGTSGGVLIPFNPSFIGAGATGTVTGLRQGQVDTLLNMPVYINVHSTQAPAGLVRAQLDKEMDYALDIPLSGANERPSPVTTTATGLAILRLTTDKTLYSNVTVSNLESNDTLTASHIHRGDATVAGPIRITLCSSKADFGVVKSQTLVDSLISILKNDPCYANAHSKLHGPGLIRGQVR